MQLLRAFVFLAPTLAALLSLPARRCCRAAFAFYS